MSTNRSLLCNGCSGILSRTQLSPACRGWWRHRSRTGSEADPSNSRRTRRARESRTARTRYTWPWRTVIHRRLLSLSFRQIDILLFKLPTLQQCSMCLNKTTIMAPSYYKTQYLDQYGTPIHINYDTYHHQGPVCWRGVVMWSLHLYFHWRKKTKVSL